MASTIKQRMMRFNGTDYDSIYLAANVESVVGGPVGVGNGGTGQTTLALARNALGLGNTTSYVPIANGGTNGNTGAKAIYNLTNPCSALTSSTLATGDYIPLLDASASTGKKVTVTNLITYLKSIM